MEMDMEIFRTDNKYQKASVNTTNKTGMIVIKNKNKNKNKKKKKENNNKKRENNKY